MHSDAARTRMHPPEILVFRKAVPVIITTLLAVPAFANTDAPASPAKSIHLASAAGRDDTTSGQQTTKHKKHHKKHHKSQQKPASSG